MSKITYKQSLQFEKIPVLNRKVNLGDIITTREKQSAKCTTDSESTSKTELLSCPKKLEFHTIEPIIVSPALGFQSELPPKLMKQKRVLLKSRPREHLSSHGFVENGKQKINKHSISKNGQNASSVGRNQSLNKLNQWFVNPAQKSCEEFTTAQKTPIRGPNQCGPTKTAHYALHSKDDENIRTHMFNIRQLVNIDDEYEIIIGHDAVKDSIETAFIQSTCLEYELNPKLTLQSMLLVGVPGIGKTALMCNAAGRIVKIIKQPISVFVISAAEILSKYIGESEKTINALWDVVQECAPSLVHFDEADSLMKSRGSDDSEHSRRYKNQLLSQMEGTRKIRNVVTLAATNRGDELDEAFLRRFKRKFILRLPNEKEREEILKYFLKLGGPAMDITMTKSQVRHIVQRTCGFTGDDIRTVIGHAATSCVRLKHDEKYYESKQINDVRAEIEASSKRPPAIMEKLTMNGLLEALRHVKPSSNAADIRKMNRWAQKHCKDSSYIESASKVFRDEGLDSDDAGCTCWLHMC